MCVRAGRGGGRLNEYEQWLLEGDVEVGLELLRRVAAQATRTASYPPPPGHRRWSDEAVDELLVQMIDEKGSTTFLIKALTNVDNQGSAERYLLTTVQNFLKDQAKATAHGKLRARLETLLGKDPRFQGVTQPVRGWRLRDAPDYWWQGDRDLLHGAAIRVRGVYITSWNTSGPTPKAARLALTTVAEAVLAATGGIVRAEDLARVLLDRFRLEIAPETAPTSVLQEVVDLTDDDPGPDETVAVISAAELWEVLSAEQRAVVPFLASVEEVAAGLGVGPKEARARRAQVLEIVRQATLDDPHAELVVRSLLDLAVRADRRSTELARLPEEQGHSEGRMSP